MLTGVLGFMMGIVVVNQIRATSPLTHNISGTAKAGVQSALAFYIWGNEATFMACAGRGMSQHRVGPSEALLQGYSSTHLLSLFNVGALTGI